MSEYVDKPPAAYQPTNLEAFKHGAYSERSIAERAVLVHTHLLEAAGWLDQPHLMPSVRRYLDATAREQLLHEALMNGTGKVNARNAEAATSAARLAAQLAHDLGLTPAGHAKLKMLTAGGAHAEASLADLAAGGREARLQAEARLAREAVSSPVQPLDDIEAADDGREAL